MSSYLPYYGKTFLLCLALFPSRGILVTGRCIGSLSSYLVKCLVTNFYFPFLYYVLFITVFLNKFLNDKHKGYIIDDIDIDDNDDVDIDFSDEVYIDLCNQVM